MKQKEAEITTVIRRDERNDGTNKYTYELMMSENKRMASYKIPLYSINVDMTDKDGKTTSARIKEAFADAGKAILFYNKVVNNLATPIDMAYILEDER